MGKFLQLVKKANDDAKKRKLQEASKPFKERKIDFFSAKPQTEQEAKFRKTDLGKTLESVQGKTYGEVIAPNNLETAQTLLSSGGNVKSKRNPNIDYFNGNNIQHATSVGYYLPKALNNARTFFMPEFPILNSDYNNLEQLAADSLGFEYNQDQKNYVPLERGSATATKAFEAYADRRKKIMENSKLDDSKKIQEIQRLIKSYINRLNILRDKQIGQLLGLVDPGKQNAVKDILLQASKANRAGATDEEKLRIQNKLNENLVPNADDRTFIKKLMPFIAKNQTRTNSNLIHT